MVLDRGVRTGHRDRLVPLGRGRTGLVPVVALPLGLVRGGPILFVSVGAASAQSRGHLLEAGYRLGLPGGVLFGLMFGDDVATDDIAGPPRLAVLIMRHWESSPVIAYRSM
jgi:hypothetical protein